MRRTRVSTKKTRLYILQAKDEAVHIADQHKLTKAVQTELLQRVNPEKTKGLPSFLPLYRGVKLLLSSKDCVRFGIVKGCVVTLRDIVFADEEILPDDLPAGQPHALKYMPLSLLLQAEEAVWQLRSTELPKGLPRNIDRPGLFQLSLT